MQIPRCARNDTASRFFHTFCLRSAVLFQIRTFESKSRLTIVNAVAYGSLRAPATIIVYIRLLPYPLDLGNPPANTLPMKGRAQVRAFLAALAFIGAVMGGGRQPLAAPPQAVESRLELSPSEIKIYKSAQTLIDWAPKQIHHCPYLRKLRPVQSQDGLPKLLGLVGQTVTLQFHDFPQIACDEVISETRPEDKLEFMWDRPITETSDAAERQKFRYIIVPWPVGDVPAFEEYRTDLHGNPLDASRLRGFSMFSAKYASTCLHFSPADQHDDRFRYFGIQTVRERECHVVGFAQQPEKARRIDRFHSQGATFGLLCQGLAWIDPESFQILRVTSWLLAPRTDIGLSSLTSTVDLYPVQPSGSERVLWLPRDVTVMLVSRGKRVRNTHRYSDYKLFRVESTIKPGG